MITDYGTKSVNHQANGYLCIVAKFLDLFKE